MVSLRVFTVKFVSHRTSLLNQLELTTNVSEIRTWIYELRSFLAVRHIVYHTVNHRCEQIGAFTYSATWARCYIEKNYASVDPVLIGVRNRSCPIDWKSLNWSSGPARQLLRDATAHGVGNQGWTVPVWGPAGELAVFAVNDDMDDDSWGRFVKDNREELLLMAHLVHQRVMRLSKEAVSSSSRELSPREREALGQLSLGYSRAVVANSLSISENTLRAYIDSARAKLGAINVTHAISLALSNGLIAPSWRLPHY